MTIMLQTTPTDPAALARRPDTPGPLAVATPTTRRLADASISRNTRRAYAGALRRLDAWRGAAPVDDASLAVYLGELFEAGRAPATAALAVAAVRFRAKLAGQPAPAGEATARVLGGFRRTAADRGRLDAVIAGLLFMGGAAAVGSRRFALGRRDGRYRRRRGACHRADLENESRGGRRRRAVSEERRRKRDPHRPRRPARRRPHRSGGRVVAATDSAARPPAPPASTTEVMLAGNWKTARMVAHYSAGATAERGAVARYL